MSHDIDAVLHRFTHEFYGYGNYKGKIWFIGMEEGGGNSEEEIKMRLNAWASKGCELENVASYHKAIKIDKFFTKNAVLQTTWSKLIRLLLCFQNITPTIELIRQYQAERLGRPDDETCLIELLPLPSPSTNEWLYKSISTLSYLESREKYTEELLEHRIKSIQGKIAKYSPNIVVFYSKKYSKYWEEIAGVPFAETESNILVADNGITKFAIITHPATRGVTNEYFCTVGKILRVNHSKVIPV